MISFFVVILLFISIAITPVFFFWVYFFPIPMRSKFMRPIISLWCDYLLIKTLNIKLHLKIKTKLQHPTLILCNHQSFLDIGIIMKLYRCGFVLKNTLMYTPYGLIALYIGSVFIKRASMSSFFQTSQNCQKRLKQKISICIFPEGTRSKNEELLPFKKGLIAVFYKNNTPTLLLIQYGNTKILPAKKWIPLRCKKVVVLECGLLKPNNYTNFNEYINTCYEKMQKGLISAKKIYHNS